MKKLIIFLLVLATLVPNRAPAYLLNLSTRVEIPPPFFRDDVTTLIGGFIVGTMKSRTVLIRAIGPSLAAYGLVPLADPTLSLYDAAGTLIVSNDNWKDTQANEIASTGLAPTDNLESAILITLDPGSYTAVVQGNNVNSGGPVPTSGTALVEIYNLNFTATLLNISARGAVQGVASPIIAGFIVGVEPENTLLIRGIGPSLDSFGLFGLTNPRLDLFDGDGNLLPSNDNWQDSQSADITATGLAPTDPFEAAILITLPRGSYTAVVAPVDALDHGTALAEVYKID